jgi:hypothetical protein
MAANRSLADAARLSEIVVYMFCFFMIVDRQQIKTHGTVNFR